MQTPNVQEYVDTARYPITDLGSPAGSQLIADTRKKLASDGCAVLSGFIKPSRVNELICEADKVAHLGHRSFNRTNVHFSKDDPALPKSHPVRRFYDRSNSFVPADNFGPDSILRAIYDWPCFPAFIKAALNEDRFFRYADPLADVIINVVEDGDGFPWHFDTNNFTVTLAIQNGESGGAFEYCPGLRSSTDENHAGVQAVLDGERANVKTLDLQPGDLQIFKGRYSLHRVTPVTGNRKRYVAIFSYVEREGMVGSPERTRQLYGRVLPVHYENAGQRADTLAD